MSTAKPSRVARRMMHLLGTEWCGSDSPPLGAGQSIYVEDDGVTRVFAMWDDGGFVGIGYPDKWQTHMRTKAARMFAWWTLRMWALDWFGVRSWLYFMALHRSVKGSWRLKPYPRQGRLTRRSSHDEWYEASAGLMTPEYPRDEIPEARTLDD